MHIHTRGPTSFVSVCRWLEYGRCIVVLSLVHGNPVAVADPRQRAQGIEHGTVVILSFIRISLKKIYICAPTARTNPNTLRGYVHGNQRALPGPVQKVHTERGIFSKGWSFFDDTSIFFVARRWRSRRPKGPIVMCNLTLSPIPCRRRHDGFARSASSFFVSQGVVAHGPRAQHRQRPRATQCENKVASILLLFGRLLVPFLFVEIASPTGL